MKYQILHIEDSKTDADLIKRLIQKSGLDFSYHLASDKNEVIDALDFFEPNIILCDHSLPSFNSKMAYVICKEKNPDLTFILVTGSVSETFAVDMLKAGIDDYLLKTNLQRLPVAIEMAFAKRQNEKKVQEYRLELNRSEMSLRTIFENSPTGLLLLDRNYTILELNDRTKHFNKISFGFELEKNTNLLESVPAFRRDELKRKFDQTLQGEKIKYEVGYPQQDGSKITFDVKLSPAISEEGIITGICITYDDISERKRAEEITRDSEKKYRNLIENLPEAVYTCDAAGYIQLYNKAAVKLWGREPEPGKDFWCGSWRIFNTDGSILPLDSCPMAVCLKRGIPVHGKEILIQRPDESYRHVLPYPSPIFNAEGQLAGAINMLLDVTNKKEREILIQKTEEKYGNLVEQASDAILIFSFDGIIHEFNRSCYTMLGYTKEEYAKLKLTDILVDDIIVSEDNYAAILAGETKTVNRNLLHKNGSLLESEVAVKLLTDGKVIAFARDITERKKAEQALKESEIFNRTILTSIDKSIAVVEANGNIISVNKTWNDFAINNGITILERSGAGSNYINVCKRAADAGEPFATKALQGFQQVVKKEIPFFEMEYPCHAPDEQRWFLLKIVNFADDSGKVVMMHIDISKIKKTEEERKSLTNRLLLATTSADMGIWDWNIKNNELIWDERMCRLYKINPVNFGSVYQEWISSLHPDDQERVNEEIQLAVKGKKLYDTEFRILWSDQSVRYIRATGMLEVDAGGNAVRMMGLNWDITPQKEKERHLKLLESVITNTTDSVLITEAEPSDEQGHKIVYVNEAFTKMTGYSSEEVIGKTPRILQGPKSDKAELKRLGDSIRKWKTTEITTINYKKNGDEYWVNFSVSPVANENGWYTHWIAVERDVTERKLAEIYLEELNNNLQQQAKELTLSNAELEQFAYVASHDLQEPLRMVTSFLSLLDLKYGSDIDDKGKKYIGFAVDGAKRMQKIILDLLEYSRAGRTKEDKEELDLNELLNEIKILLRQKIEEKNAVFTIDNLPKIMAHRSPMRQIFQNLVSNALKYSSSDIPVQISITVKELEDSFQFAVADNGIGISKDYFNKIFIIFQRLHNKDEYSGTGIGLAIVKKIIEIEGGKIWVESEEGKGSAFCFTIKK